MNNTVYTVFSSQYSVFYVDLSLGYRFVYRHNSKKPIFRKYVDTQVVKQKTRIMFKRGLFGGLWKPKNPHSLEHLKYLYNVLSKNQTVTESNKESFNSLIVCLFIRKFSLPSFLMIQGLNSNWLWRVRIIFSYVSEFP